MRKECRGEIEVEIIRKKNKYRREKGKEAVRGGAERGGERR